MKSLIGLLVAILIFLIDGYQNASAKPPPQRVCPCQYKYDPVCGSDGVTYMNKCILDCTSQENKIQGSPTIDAVDNCECSNCNCQKIDLPVCTLDGRTFPNECELACENLRRISNKESIINLAYRTACRGVTGRCTNITSPVCGTDNVLYRNRCVLDYVNTYNSEMGLPPITVKNNGACQDGSLCPRTREPVCGSDGNIYNNRCELDAENERRTNCYERTIYISEANPSVCNECRCPKNGNPVCGSDGNTYPNQCQLDYASWKQNNPELRTAYTGECRRCKCKEEFLPICGTDRKTYGNRCLLECQNIDRSPDNEICVFHDGECQQFICDCNYCDENGYHPMCGSDGLTYWNLCWLQCNDKCCQRNGKDSVTLSRRGPC